MSSKKINSIFNKIISGPAKPMKWQDVRALLLALGAKQKEGKGSSMKFIIGGRPLIIHKPHPDNEVKKYIIQQIKDYLIRHDLKPKSK